VGPDGKITQVIPGVPEQLQTFLLTSLDGRRAGDHSEYSLLGLYAESFHKSH
jgi:hypothetical protein